MKKIDITIILLLLGILAIIALLASELATGWLAILLTNGGG